MLRRRNNGIRLLVYQVLVYRLKRGVHLLQLLLDLAHFNLDSARFGGASRAVDGIFYCSKSLHHVLVLVLFHF